MKKNNLQIKLPRYKTHENAHLFPKTYEPVSEVSMTIQNETLSLREIVEKFSREYPSHLQRQGYYDYDENSNEDFDDVDLTRNSDFDLVDAYELKEQIQSKKKQKEQNMSSFTKSQKQNLDDSKNSDNEKLSSPNTV